MLRFSNVSEVSAPCLLARRVSKPRIFRYSTIARSEVPSFYLQISCKSTRGTSTRERDFRILLPCSILFFGPLKIEEQKKGKRRIYYQDERFSTRFHATTAMQLLIADRPNNYYSSKWCARNFQH